MGNKILVAIISANEKDLKQTVLSAMDNSANPEDLTFVIFDSLLNGFPEIDFTEFKNVFYMKMEFSGTQGVGLARLIASSIIPPDTDYVLQLDSHMLFVKDWDVKLINGFQMLEKIADKPIISSRAPSWEYDENGEIVYSEVNDSVQKLVFKNLEIAVSQDGYPTIEGADVLDGEYIEHNLISAQFTFSRPDLYSEILHDPRLVWGGDEPIVSLRAWSRGYRMFSIRPTICFHYNKKTTRGAPGKDNLDDWRSLKNNDQRLFKFYAKRYNDGKKIMRDILLGDYIGYWGSESIEKLREFESACGVDFQEFYKILDQKKSKL
jgi:hypothetical protein